MFNKWSRFFNAIELLLTLHVPDKVEDTGFHESLWDIVHCYMKLNVINHLNLNPLETQKHNL